MIKKDSPVFLKADKIVFTVAKWYSVIAAICIIVAMVLCVLDVVTSKLFNYTISIGVELVTWLLIPIVYTTLAYIQLDGGHINVDLVQKHLPKGVNDIINGFNCLLGCAMCVYTGHRSWILAMSYLAKHEKSSLASYGFVLWPFAMLIAIGFFTLAFTYLWTILRMIFKSPEVHVESWEMTDETPGEDTTGKEAAE